MLRDTVLPGTIVSIQFSGHYSKIFDKKNIATDQIDLCIPVQSWKNCVQLLETLSQPSENKSVNIRKR